MEGRERGRENRPRGLKRNGSRCEGGREQRRPECAQPMPTSRQVLHTRSRSGLSKHFRTETPRACIIHRSAVVQQDCTPEHFYSACCFRDPFMPCIEFPIPQMCAKITVWGGRLGKRFSNMFSESSPCLVGLHGRCAVQANGLWNSLKTFYKTFYSTCCPRL